MKYHDDVVDVVIDVRDGGDWSLDLCFAGLVNNLGPGRIIDVPAKDKHREWGIGENSWGKERRTLGYTSLNHLIDNKLNGRGICRVWLDERMESFYKYRELLYDRLKVNVVVVAGHDRFWNHSPKFVADLYGENFEAMLLDNWYDEYSKLPFKARRIGWSTNFNHYWNRPITTSAKDIDISFMGYNSHQDRFRYVEHISKKWSHLNNHIVLETRPDTTESFIAKAQYFDIMQRSKICLNLRGAADRGKTMRAYEIPYVGSFMLSQRIDDPGMHSDFINQTHCLYFNNENELDTAIDWALNNEAARENIAMLGHKKAIGQLSVKERWKDVLQWLDK